MAALKPKHDLRAVAKQFAIDGEFEDARPHGNGHINDTYAAAFRQNGRAARYVFQRINHGIFKNPPALM
ncbi:MAG: mucin desulfatase, partial [Verrucomicrobia bacterium]|nr:mucin desulfatase [Verrucomicrobiota bacterium]